MRSRNRERSQDALEQNARAVAIDRRRFENRLEAGAIRSARRFEIKLAGYDKAGCVRVTRQTVDRRQGLRRVKVQIAITQSKMSDVATFRKCVRHGARKIAQRLALRQSGIHHPEPEKRCRGGDDENAGRFELRAASTQPNQCNDAAHHERAYPADQGEEGRRGACRQRGKNLEIMAIRRMEPHR